MPSPRDAIMKDTDILSPVMDREALMKCVIDGNDDKSKIEFRHGSLPSLQAVSLHN